MIYFFAGFEAASQDILEYVGQEAASEDAEKEAKSETLEYRDRFMDVCSNVSFAKVGKAAAQAMSALQTRTQTAACRALALIASVLGAFYNPVYGVALLITAVVLWKIGPGILAYISGTRKEAPLPPLQKPEFCLEKIVQMSEDPEEVLNQLVKRVDGTELRGIEDCRIPSFFEAAEDEGPSYYRGVDAQNRPFYAYKYGTAQELIRGVEVVYKEVDGVWKAGGWIVAPSSSQASANIVLKYEPASVLEGVFQHYKGVELMGVEDCTTHPFGNGCFKGVDSQGRPYYAFQLFYKNAETDETSTDIEVVYQETGVWKASKKALFFNEGRLDREAVPQIIFRLLAQVGPELIFPNVVSWTSCSFKPVFDRKSTARVPLGPPFPELFPTARH